MLLYARQRYICLILCLYAWKGVAWIWMLVEATIDAVSPHGNCLSVRFQNPKPCFSTWTLSPCKEPAYQILFLNMEIVSMKRSKPVSMWSFSTSPNIVSLLGNFLHVKIQHPNLFVLLSITLYKAAHALKSIKECMMCKTKHCKNNKRCRNFTKKSLQTIHFSNVMAAFFSG